MNNWKLRSVITGTNTDDLVEVNGHLAAPSTSDVPVLVVPFGHLYAASIRATASDTFGPVSNQVPGITNGTFTHTGTASGNVASTTLTGEGSGAFFNYTFLADGTLSTITANTGGNNYKVGDKLRITTSGEHGSQVIEFRLVDGSNSVSLGMTIPHDRTSPLPFAVHRARVNSASSFTFHVLDYRSQQVFPRPQDKLLDRFPNAAAAYGLRLLRSAYLGPAIRVSRSSDSAEKDIYFDSQGNLDTTALKAHVGASLGRVKTWYDQSGNGNDATQSSTSQRPPITSASGELITVNGKPALRFDGSNDKFAIDSSDLYGQDRFDAYMHYQTDEGSFIMLSDPDSTARASFVPQNNSTSPSLLLNYDINGVLPTLYVNGVKPGIVYGTTTRDELHTMLVTNGASHSNGAIVVHEAAGTQGWTDIGISNYSSFGFGGRLTEMVLYNTDQSANRENIEKDMALHSGAYQVEDAPLLDAYGGAHAAYSLRKLNSDYTGYAARVSRDSDNTEMDVGFDADGNFDKASVDATFYDNTNIRLKTWYDQSGNGNDMTQSTVGQRPLVYNNVGALKVDGRVGPRFVKVDDAGDNFTFDPTGLDIGNLSTFAVLKAVGDLSPIARVIQLSAGATTRWYAPVITGGYFQYNAGDSTNITITADNSNNLHTLISGATQGDVEAFFNGVSKGTKSLPSGIGSVGYIGGYGVDWFNGHVHELIVYSSDQSGRREGIERNISNYYDL